MPPNPDGNDESHIFIRGMKLLAAMGCFLILFYSLRFWATGDFLRIFGVGMLVAGAALLSGFLLGFIFAIPRVGYRKGMVPAADLDGAQMPGSGEQPDSVPFNANLVEISDWLTKIIVGVGLVELHSVPGKLGEVSYYLALALQAAPCAGGASCAGSLAGGQAAGLGIVIFYSTLGFLLGYVWTMMPFQSDLKRQIKQLERQKEAEQRLKQAAILMMSAEASINANELDKAMDTIDDAIKFDPENGYALMTKARILKRQAFHPGRTDRDKLLKQALAYIEQAVARLPNKGEPIYNKACYEALLNLKDLRSDVLENLATAIRFNPALRKLAKEDGDLANLRQDDDFIKLMSES